MARTSGTVYLGRGLRLPMPGEGVVLEVPGKPGRADIEGERVEEGRGQFEDVA